MIDPDCLKHTHSDAYPDQGLAYTATGHIVPCCWFDTPDLFKSNHSYIAKELTPDTTIKAIVESDDWIAFYDNLKRGIGLPPCHRRCTKVNK